MVCVQYLSTVCYWGGQHDKHGLPTAYCGHTHTQRNCTGQRVGIMPFTLYNVILWRVRWPLLAWKSNKYYISCVSVCIRSYPACNAHAPYCHMWPVWPYHTFYQIISKTANGGGRVLNIKRVCAYLSRILETVTLRMCSDFLYQLRSHRRHFVKFVLCLCLFLWVKHV